MAEEDGRVGQVHGIDGNANDNNLENLARFAVEEHNKKQNAMLQFKKLVDAKQQVVAGIIYHLKLEATDGDAKKLYEAKVWEKAWMNSKELQEFKLLGDAPSQD